MPKPPMSHRHQIDIIMLQQLPTELIEQVALHLVNYRSRRHNDLCSLRLASRTLCSKTQHVFVKETFSTRVVDITLDQLERLLDISHHDVYGPAVKKLRFCLDEVKEQDYEQLRARVEGDEYDGPLELFWRRKHLLPYPGDHERLEKCNSQLRDRTYVEKSGIDTTLLTLAFRNLPNLKEVEIVPPCATLSGKGPQRQSSGPNDHSLGSTTHLTSTVLSAIALSRANIQKLVMDPHISDYGQVCGLGIEALDMPRRHMESFAMLQELDLMLCAQDCSYDYLYRPDVKTPLLGSFLSRTISLKSLVLAFDNWTGTERILSNLAHQVSLLPGLELLDLQRTRFTEKDLIRLLKTLQLHLRHLSFNTCDLIDGSWLNILLYFEQHHRNLSSLLLFQLAESGKCVEFPTTGQILTMPEDYDGSTVDGKDEWCIIQPSLKYQCLVEEWEDMGERMRAFREDCVVSGKVALMPLHYFVYEGDWRWEAPRRI